MPIIDTLKDAILKNVGSLRQAPKNWFRKNCPLCVARGYGADTRSRFGLQFNSESIVVHCFNCSFSASHSEGRQFSKNFKFFLDKLGITDQYIRALEFEIFKERSKIVSDRPSSLLSRPQTTWAPITLPKGAKSIKSWLEVDTNDHNFLQVAQYAMSRGIYDLENFYWVPSTFENLSQRVLIPYYYRGILVGYTARLCYEPKTKEIPKYMQRSPTDFVYNLDIQSSYERKFVIVNEGVLDARAVDGVGTLGEMNKAKIDLINALNKKVIVCPDRDKKGGDLVDVAIEQGWAVSFPKWSPGIKDAAEASMKYGRLLTTHSILDSAILGKQQIQLRWSIAQNERDRKNTRKQNV